MSEREVSNEKAQIQILRTHLQKLSTLSRSGADPLLRRIQAQKAETIPQCRSRLQNSKVVSEETVAYDLPDLWFC